MRYSNYIFTKGSIVFIRFPANSPYAYLNGRPLVVISNPTHILKTLVVCTTGTRDKPGIQVSFWNYQEQMFVGDTDVSRIYPYSIMTIYTDQIEDCIGQLDPYILKALDKAVDFHLGRTDEIPPYLKECEEDITGVTAEPIKDKYISREVVSPQLTLPYTYKKEYRRRNNLPEISASTPTPVKMTPIIPVEKLNTTEQPVEQVTNEDIRRWLEAPVPENLSISNKSCRDQNYLLNNLDETSVNYIVSRVVPIALVAKKFNTNQRVATFLRIALTNISVHLATSILNSKNTGSIKSVGDHIIVGMILVKAFNPERINSENTQFDQSIVSVAKKYRINTDDRRTWRSVENFYG